MSATVMDRGDLDVLVTGPTVAIVVLDPKIGKVHGLFEVRQLVFPGPEPDLLRRSIGTSVAVFAMAIAPLEKPLVVPLELVIENHAADTSAALTKALFSSKIRAVDVRVVSKFSRLAKARVEGLDGSTGPVVAFPPGGFEQVTASARQDHHVFVRSRPAPVGEALRRVSTTLRHLALEFTDVSRLSGRPPDAAC